MTLLDILLQYQNQYISTPSIVIGVISALGGGTIVKIVDIVTKNKRSMMLDPKMDALEFRKSLVKRIKHLEGIEADSNKKILELSKKNSSLEEKLVHLEKSNNMLIEMLSSHFSMSSEELRKKLQS